MREEARKAAKRRKERLEESRSIKRKRIAEDETNNEVRSTTQKRKANVELNGLQKRARKESTKRNRGISIQDSIRETTSIGANFKAWDFGKPTYKCRHCDALLWRSEERRVGKEC